MDLYTLHKLFDNFGRDEPINSAALNAAVQEHTHWYINDITVTSEEFYKVFSEEGRLSPLRITETNIYDAVLVKLESRPE